MLAIKAFDPVTGGEIEVYISQERLLAIGKRSQGQTLEAAYLVPLTLQCQGLVFEGLRREADEDRRGAGWRCYCSLPDRSYAPDGVRRSPRRGHVYLVFVNDDRVAYNWRWEPADPSDSSLPLAHENRFRRRLA
jgi:hypothetical protein